MTADPSSPAHLTEVLRRAGVLGDARVSRVTIEGTRPTILSQIIRLHLDDAGSAAAAMPVRLTPRCFGAHADPATKTWHLLLEDLTDTHDIATRWPLPPSPTSSATS